MKYLFLTLFLFSCAKAQVLFHAHNQASAPACDADATAFNTAAGITNPVEQAAVCQLATSLKSASLWNKMYAIYPMVGGTATTCKFNLKDPRDLDAAFRITWGTGTTFSGNGVQFPGGSAWSSTYFIPSANAGPSSLCFSFYSRTNNTVNGGDMGTASGVNTGLYIKYTDGNMYGILDGAVVATAMADSRGFFVVSRTSTTSLANFKNGVLLTTNSTPTASALATAQVAIGGVPESASKSNRECALASISQGLTAAEVSALYTIIQTFETALSRQM